MNFEYIRKFIRFILIFQIILYSLGVFFDLFEIVDSAQIFSFGFRMFLIPLTYYNFKMFSEKDSIKNMPIRTVIIASFFVLQVLAIIFV